MTDRLRRLVPDRTTAVALLTLAVTVALFAPTVVGYVSYEQVSNADVAVDSMAVSEDGSELVTTLSVSNPTGVPITVTEASLYVRANRNLVNNVGGIDVERTTIPAGETGAVPVRIPLLDDERDRAKRGLDTGTTRVSGELNVEVRGQKRELKISGVTVA